MGRIKKILKKIEQNILSDKLSCSLKFRLVFGRGINWKNPQTFEEKIQWRKIYGLKRIYTICSDRYLVRDYIKKKIGEKYLVPLLFQTKNPRLIDFNVIDVPFIIKTNNNEGSHLIVFDKKNFNKKAAIEYFSNALRKNQYYKLWRERQYKYIEPRVIIEKLLIDEKEKGKIPKDYKFHCFNGKVEMIQVDIDRFQRHKRVILNRDWKTLPLSFTVYENGKPCAEMIENVEKPPKLKEMIRLAEKLSSDFDYVRVDLYNLDKKIYFGELTFTPGGGLEKFTPIKWDYYYGRLWKLNK